MIKSGHDVKVDSQLIKTEREKRAWSQEHLAQVAGIGHRTIQRIESTGMASFESVMALAAALAVDTSDLRIDITNLPTVTKHQSSAFRMEIGVRLLLAILSGVAVPLILAAEIGGSEFFETLIALFCGGLFGVTVLCPYLQRDKHLLVKSISLVAASALSFYYASWTAEMMIRFGDLIGFVSASVVGIGIVVAGGWFIAPLRLKKEIWLPVIAASLTGGAAFYLGFVVISDFEYGHWGSVAGFCMWHGLMSMLFYFSRTRDDTGNRLGSILADFLAWTRQKLRELNQTALNIQRGNYIVWLST